MTLEPFDLTDGEEWRPVVGYEGVYTVSNFGRVRRVGEGSRGCGHFMQTTKIKGTGYLGAKLTHQGIQKTKAVHRLVLEAFVGPCPEGMESCHNDGNRLNANLSNLRWDTCAANQADRIKHGTSQIGKMKPDFRRLEQEELDGLNALAAAGKSVREISALIGLSPTQIRRILNGDCRSRVPLPPTHCPKGHEYTPENSKFRKSGKRAGQRRCKACMREYHARKIQAVGLIPRGR